MNAGKTVFAQLLDHLPRYVFNKLVTRYRGNYKISRFPCWSQFLCLCFAQLTYRESLRDIETCLNSHRQKLYHIGFRGQVSRSTLADANEHRDYSIYQELGYHLIKIASRLYQNEDLGLDLKNVVYALDSTTIDLCLSAFPWAHYKRTKAAIKIHTHLNLRGKIPDFIILTNGNVHDTKPMDNIEWEPDSITSLDRGYTDFGRLYQIHLAGAFFVIKAKRNLRVKRIRSNPIDKTTGVQADQIVVLANAKSRSLYPEAFRRVRYYDRENNSRVVLLTNNFAISAVTVADIYRSRWQVELFFKWIKQHLRIKSFFGTSPNAVRTQIWSALVTYLLVAIVKKRLEIPGELHTFLQILEVNIFEKRPILQVFRDAMKHEVVGQYCNQLRLFEL